MSSEVLFPSEGSENDINKPIRMYLPLDERESVTSGGGGPNSKPYVRPSFFHRLRSVDDPEALVEVSIIDVFPPEDFTAFSLFHDLETDYARALFRGESYSVMIKGGLLQRIWIWANGFYHFPNKDRLERKVPIPVGELHVPNVEGAKAFYKFSRVSEEKVTISVSVVGLGAGGSVSQEVVVGANLEVLAGKCAGLVSDADILITHWENPYNHKVIKLVEEIELDDWVYSVPLESYPALDKTEDICTNQNAYSLLRERVDKSKLRRKDDYRTISPGTGGRSEYFIGIKKEDEYIAKCLLSELDNKVGWEVKSRYTKTTRFEYHLPPFHHYIAVKSNVNRQPFTWGAEEMTLTDEDSAS
jgi:hypothetical protein